jgi:hypothetical protein
VKPTDGLIGPILHKLYIPVVHQVNCILVVLVKIFYAINSTSTKRPWQKIEILFKMLSVSLPFKEHS